MVPEHDRQMVMKTKNTALCFNEVNRIWFLTIFNLQRGKNMIELSNKEYDWVIISLSKLQLILEKFSLKQLPLI